MLKNLLLTGTPFDYLKDDFTKCHKDRSLADDDDKTFEDEID